MGFSFQGVMSDVKAQIFPMVHVAVAAVIFCLPIYITALAWADDAPDYGAILH